MNKIRVKFKPGALYKLRTSPERLADVDRRARRVARAAEADGGKYRVRTAVGEKHPQGRARSSVTTANFQARRINSKRHSLLRALDSGR